MTTYPRFCKVFIIPWSLAYFNMFFLISPTQIGSFRWRQKCFKQPSVCLHTYSFVQDGKGQLKIVHITRKPIYLPILIANSFLTLRFFRSFKLASFYLSFLSIAAYASLGAPKLVIFKKRDFPVLGFMLLLTKR